MMRLKGQFSIRIRLLTNFSHEFLYFSGPKSTRHLEDWPSEKVTL